MDLISCRSREEELKKVTKVAEILSGKVNKKFPWSFEQGMFYNAFTILRVLTTSLVVLKE